MTFFPFGTVAKKKKLCKDLAFLNLEERSLKIEITLAAASNGIYYSQYSGCIEQEVEGLNHNKGDLGLEEVL